MEYRDTPWTVTEKGSAVAMVDGLMYIFLAPF